MKTRTPLIVAAAAVVCFAALLVLGRGADRIEIGAAAFDRVEIQVNEFTASAQSHVSLDMDEQGNIVTVWDSRRQDRGTYGVFARWIDPSGHARGPEEQVNVERKSMQMGPAVSIRNDGTAWFAWESINQDGDLRGIVCRGKGDEAIVNVTTAGDQAHVAVDHLTDGRSVAAWVTSGSDPFPSLIVARVLAGECGTSSDEIIISAPEGCRDQLPSVAATVDGGFVVAWARTGPDGEGDGIYACRFDHRAEVLGAPFRVSEPALLAIEPSVAADAAGRFTVGWLRYDEENDYDVMIRRYDLDGRPLGSETVATTSRAGIQSGAALAMSAGGNLLVAWNEESEDGLEVDVRARLFDPDGNPIGADFLVNRHTEGLQRLPAGTGVRRVDLAGDGRMAFAWEGSSGRGDETSANVTVLIPADAGIAGDLAAGIRLGRSLLASAIPDGGPHLDASATPHIPPTLDEAGRGPLLDPNSMIVRDGEIGFTAFTDRGWYPPDPHMAAGHDYLMATVNGGLAAYTKDGTVLWDEDISGAGGFWGELGATYLVFDPEVIYDPYENRFIAMANERSDDSRSMFLLGISSTSDPTDPWYKYRFDVTALAGNDTDSPNIAVDSEAIYITADFFGPQKYLIYIIDKSSVLDGGAAVTTSYLHTGTQSFGIPVMYSDDAPMMYMIEHFEDDPSNTVRLWAIQDALGTPNLVSFTLDVPAYYRPANLRSMGTGARPLTFDARFWSCMYRDGSLWAAHHMSLASSPRITASRWYEIEMNGWPVTEVDPVLKQSGTVAPAGEVYCSFNSICANADGSAMMVFARSSVLELFSMSRTYRLASDPLGFMSPPEYVKQSDVTYTRDRWGDYSAIVADPADPTYFWMHHEYAAAASSWHTWIAGEAVINPNSAVADIDGSPIGLRIWPSPTAGPATIAFDLSRATPVEVEIFDVSGRLVQRVDLGELGAGGHQVPWDGGDLQGADVANGVYMVRVTSGTRLLASERLVVAR